MVSIPNIIQSIYSRIRHPKRKDHHAKADQNNVKPSHSWTINDHRYELQETPPPQAEKEVPLGYNGICVLVKRENGSYALYVVYERKHGGSTTVTKTDKKKMKKMKSKPEVAKHSESKLPSSSNRKLEVASKISNESKLSLASSNSSIHVDSSSTIKQETSNEETNLGWIRLALFKPDQGEIAVSHLNGSLCFIINKMEPFWNENS